MDKVKTLEKPRRSSKNTRTVRLKKNVHIEEYSPTVQLTDENFIARAVWDCLKDNDPEGVLEIIEAHLEAVNNLRTVCHAKSSLVTLPKEKNPTLRALAHTIHKIPSVSLPLTIRE